MAFPLSHPLRIANSTNARMKRAYKKKTKIKQPFITLGKTKETKQLFSLYEFVYFFIFIFFGGAKERKRKLAMQNDPRNPPARKRLQKPSHACTPPISVLFFFFFSIFQKILVGNAPDYADSPLYSFLPSSTLHRALHNPSWYNAEWAPWTPCLCRDLRLQFEWRDILPNTLSDSLELGALAC